MACTREMRKNESPGLGTAVRSEQGESKIMYFKAGRHKTMQTPECHGSRRLAEN